MLHVLFCLLVAFIHAQPDLPNHFEGSVRLSSQSGGMTGYLYFDYTHQAYRFDADDRQYTEITLFNTLQPSRYVLDGTQCKRELLPDNSKLFTMQIPSYATFSGYSTIDGRVCQNWVFDFLGATEKFSVANFTDITDLKTTWNHVSTSIVTPYIPNGLILAFDEQEDSPPDTQLFDVSSLNCSFPPPDPLKSYTFGGFAKNAQTNKILPGASVSLKSQTDTFSSSTNQQGYYLFTNVPSGNYTLSVRSSGFYEFNAFVTIDSSALPGSYGDTSLAPSLIPGQWRAVLTWNFEPRDIDLHVRTPYGCDVSYKQRFCSSGSSYVELDLDTTEGWGPESLTFNGGSGNYTIYTYIYEGSAAYTVSNARIRLYTGNSPDSLVADIPVLTEFYDERNRFWNVLYFDPLGSSPLSVNVVNEVLPFMF